MPNFAGSDLDHDMPRMLYIFATVTNKSTIS